MAPRRSEKLSPPASPEPPESIECASPPCLAGEVDPAYMGLLMPDEPAPPGPAPVETASPRRAAPKPRKA